MREKVLLSWSGGKDCTMALYEIQRENKYEISGLLTTMTKDYDRISMHGIRSVLLQQQAQSLGFPLEVILIPRETSIDEYESIMETALAKFRRDGVSSVVFGDIFLEGVRKYREGKLSQIGMTGLFPLWERRTVTLAHAFIDLGFKAVTTCINPEVLDKAFVGRLIDERFLAELPCNVDPSGENGEFHSFVFEGPIFKERIPYTLGEVVLRSSFYFCDLLPTLPQMSQK
jgi:uncharacterized protein (TIGR00290 family)